MRRSRAHSKSAGFAAEFKFDALLAVALTQREWISAAVRLDMDERARLAEAERIYRAALQLDPGASLDDVTENLARILPDAELRRVRDVLASGSNGDIKCSEKIAAALATGGATARVTALCDVFFTATGDARKSIMTKGLSAKHPDVAAMLQRAQDQFVRLHEERCKLQLLEATLALSASPMPAAALCRRQGASAQLSTSTTL